MTDNRSRDGHGAPAHQGRIVWTPDRWFMCSCGSVAIKLPDVVNDWTAINAAVEQHLEATT